MMDNLSPRQVELRQRMTELMPNKKTLRVSDDDEKLAVQDLIDDVCFELQVQKVGVRSHNVRNYLDFGSNTTYKRYVEDWLKREDEAASREASSNFLAEFAREVKRHEKVVLSKQKQDFVKLDDEANGLRDSLEESQAKVKVLELELANVKSERDRVNESAKKARNQKLVAETTVVNLQEENISLKAENKLAVQNEAVAIAEKVKATKAKIEAEHSRDEAFGNEVRISAELEELRGSFSELKADFKESAQKLAESDREHQVTRNALVAAETTVIVSQSNADRADCERRKVEQSLAKVEQQLKEQEGKFEHYKGIDSELRKLTEKVAEKSNKTNSELTSVLTMLASQMSRVELPS